MTHIYPSHLKMLGSARINGLSDKALIWKSSGSKSRISNAVWKPVKLALGSPYSVPFHRQRTWKGLVIPLRSLPCTEPEYVALNPVSWSHSGISSIKKPAFAGFFCLYGQTTMELKISIWLWNQLSFYLTKIPNPVWNVARTNTLRKRQIILIVSSFWSQ